MPIVSKPRRIVADLDPDQGFPVSLLVESIRYVEEDGQRVADLPAHIESLAPDSAQAVTLMGDVASAATSALITYQTEVQRLAVEGFAKDQLIADIQAQIQAMTPTGQ